MRWRMAALISLGINVCLAAGWLIASRQSRVAAQDAAAAKDLAAPTPKTNTIVRRQFFSWQEIESPDYPTYISNLRDIGCPEQTIRDIIIADVNSLFSRRRATELTTPDQQWWRSEPDTNVLQSALQKVRALEEERFSLLSSLLGPNWETGDMVSLPRPTRPGILLDGPVLGSLPQETKQTLQELNERSEQRMKEYLQARTAEGKNADPAEIAALRKQTREELAKVLPPVQLEEYLLRYSQNASDLRSQLGELEHFDATPDEFRALFRATDHIDNQVQALSGNESQVAEQKQALLEARENAIRVALGPRRYEDYRMLQDPLYRQAVAEAEQAGTPEAARTIYQVNLAAAVEQAGIGVASNLTATQKAIALKQLELEQMTATALASGQEPMPPVPPTPLPRRTITVGAGDNLAVISMIYGVPQGLIQQVNPNVNFNRLRPGDVITLPPGAGQPSLGAP
jgi:LysM repeat protein